MPPPPISTLFPYTTLFRSQAQALHRVGRLLVLEAREQGPQLFAVVLVERSEEHTSELQSLTNLVCRLLLEKKKVGHLVSKCPWRNPSYFTASSHKVQSLVI